MRFDPARLNAKFNQRMAKVAQKTGSTRFDLCLWDHQLADKRTARVLIGFNPELGIPKRMDVDKFIMASFNGQIRTMLETIELHPENNVITASVFKIPQVIPEEYATNMVKVGVSQWQDENNAIWELREKGDARFLARIEAENLDELLKDKEKSTRTASYHKRPRLASLSTVGETSVGVGDKVAFTHHGSVMEGQVLAINGNQIKIDANGVTLDTLRPSIMNIVEAAEGDKKMSDQELIDFFTKAYGDRGFATKLVKQ